MDPKCICGCQREWPLHGSIVYQRCPSINTTDSHLRWGHRVQRRTALQRRHTGGQLDGCCWFDVFFFCPAWGLGSETFPSTKVWACYGAGADLAEMTGMIVCSGCSRWASERKSPFGMARAPPSGSFCLPSPVQRRMRWCWWDLVQGIPLYY